MFKTLYDNPDKVNSWRRQAVKAIANDAGPVMGDVCIFVPARDPRSLAEAILHLLSDEAFRTKLGQYAGSIAVKRYSWRIVAEAITPLFQQLLNLPHPS